MSVQIYTTPTCPYCVKAKTLLQRKGVAFEEIDVAQDPVLRQQVSEKAGGRTTVPQIFIKGLSIGGCDDLYTLDQQGKLDKMLMDEGS